MAKTKKNKGALGQLVWRKAKRLDQEEEAEVKIEVAFAFLRIVDENLSEARKAVSRAQFAVRSLSKSESDTNSSRIRAPRKTALVGTGLEKRIHKRSRLDSKSSNRSTNPRTNRSNRKLEQLRSRRQSGYAEKSGGQPHEIEHGSR